MSYLASQSSTDNETEGNTSNQQTEEKVSPVKATIPNEPVEPTKPAEPAEPRRSQPKSQTQPVEHNFSSECLAAPTAPITALNSSFQDYSTSTGAEHIETTEPQQSRWKNYNRLPNLLAVTILFLYGLITDTITNHTTIEKLLLALTEESFSSSTRGLNMDFQFVSARIISSFMLCSDASIFSRCFAILSYWKYSYSFLKYCKRYSSCKYQFRQIYNIMQWSNPEAPTLVEFLGASRVYSLYSNYIFIFRSISNDASFLVMLIGITVVLTDMGMGLPARILDQVVFGFR
jgi:hypothetical protein